MEAITVICSPDMQGQPLVYRLHSLSNPVCERTDDAGVLDTVQGSGPPGLTGFLSFHAVHSPQRAASTHPLPRLCPPWFNLEEKRNKINKRDNLDKTRSSDVIHQFQFWPFACLLICLHVLFLEVHVSGEGCWQLASARKEKCALILWLCCRKLSKALNLSAHKLKPQDSDGLVTLQANRMTGCGRCVITMH